MLMDANGDNPRGTTRALGHHVTFSISVSKQPENTSKGLCNGINMIRDHTNRSGDVGPVVFDPCQRGGS